ncbi:hypothetical protein DL95DRAFT_404410 [Leptodontidium sp. 2 PMI_412]|nr:hypothetical protein DL95DRAFT_404410 [Leptodontidium sp. 2 PMI_412]
MSPTVLELRFAGGILESKSILDLIGTLPSQFQWIGVTHCHAAGVHTFCTQEPSSSGGILPNMELGNSQILAISGGLIIGNIRNYCEGLMTDKIKLAGGDLTLEAPLGKTSVYRFSVEELPKDNSPIKSHSAGPQERRNVGSSPVVEELAAGELPWTCTVLP